MAPAAPAGCAACAGRPASRPATGASFWAGTGRTAPRRPGGAWRAAASSRFSSSLGPGRPPTWPCARRPATLLDLGEIQAGLGALLVAQRWPTRSSGCAASPARPATAGVVARQRQPLALLGFGQASQCGASGCQGLLLLGREFAPQRLGWRRLGRGAEAAGGVPCACGLAPAAPGCAGERKRQRQHAQPAARRQRRRSGRARRSEGVRHAAGAGHGLSAGRRLVGLQELDEAGIGVGGRRQVVGQQGGIDFGQFAGAVVVLRSC